MSPADHAVLVRAAELHRPLARAARLGRGNAMGYAVCGGLSLMFAAVSLDPIGGVLSGLVLGVGVYQRGQCRLLMQADGAAAQRLMRAELVLLAAIVVYGVLGLTMFQPVGDELKRQLRGSEGLGIDIGQLAEAISRVWYSSLILVSVLYQGGMARYYHGRRAAVVRYVEAVPQWARLVVEPMAG